MVEINQMEYQTVILAALAYYTKKSAEYSKSTGV